jgi:hypothetical protein
MARFLTYQHQHQQPHLPRHPTIPLALPRAACNLTAINPAFASNKTMALYTAQVRNPGPLLRARCAALRPALRPARSRLLASNLAT